MEAVSTNFNITGAECASISDEVDMNAVNCADVNVVVDFPPIIKTFDGDREHNAVFIDDVATDGHNDGDTASVNSADNVDDDLVVGNEDRD